MSHKPLFHIAALYDHFFIFYYMFLVTVSYSPFCGKRNPVCCFTQYFTNCSKISRSSRKWSQSEWKSNTRCTWARRWRIGVALNSIYFDIRNLWTGGVMEGTVGYSIRRGSVSSFLMFLCVFLLAISPSSFSPVSLFFARCFSVNTTIPITLRWRSWKSWFA